MESHYGNLGGTLEDATLVKKQLDSIPEKFFLVVAEIEQFYDIDSMSFEEAIGRLKAYEERASLRDSHSSNDG